MLGPNGGDLLDHNQYAARRSRIGPAQPGLIRINDAPGV
jgi:hypothetical protein